MTQMSQAETGQNMMIFQIAARLARLGAAAGLVLAPHAQAEQGPRLYPMCAFGTVILLPFPGEDAPAPQERKAACHAARLNERLRVFYPLAKGR